jgi:hypothetical protein
MAFVTSETISKLAVQLLSAELSLIETVAHVPETDVAPPSGGETILRVPVPRTARIQERGGSLVSDEVNELEVPFTVEHVYDKTTINAHQRELDIESFDRQVTGPQTRSVAAGAERQLANVMNGLPVDLEVALTGADLDNQVADAVAILDEAENPMDDRWLAVSPQFAARLTSPNAASLTDYQGEIATEALRRGIVGEYRGLIVVKSPRLTGFKAFAYHKSAFAWANMTPPEIKGTVDSASFVVEGVGIRHVFQVTPDLETESTLSTWAGAELVDADRVVVLGQDDES